MVTTIFILTVLLWIVCPLLIGLILLQGGAGDISSAFGGGGSLDSTLGVGAGRKMSKITAWLAAFFFIAVTILAIPREGNLSRAAGERKVSKMAPAVPTAPVPGATTAPIQVTPAQAQSGAPVKAPAAVPTVPPTVPPASVTVPTVPPLAPTVPAVPPATPAVPPAVPTVPPAAPAVPPVVPPAVPPATPAVPPAVPPTIPAVPEPTAAPAPPAANAPAPAVPAPPRSGLQLETPAK